MRVLMTADCVGGVWTYAATLCHGLAGRADVTLAVTGGELTDAQRAMLPAGVRVEHRPLRCEWMQPPLADVGEVAAWLRGLVADVRPDVLHLNDYALAAHLPGPKLVVAHSDVLSWHRHVLGETAGDGWADYAEAVRAGLFAADAVIGVTAAVLDDLRDSFGFVGGEVIHNATDLEAWSGGERPHDVLTAGRVWDEAKNVRVLSHDPTGHRNRSRIETHSYDPLGHGYGEVDVAGDAAHPDGGTAEVAGLNLLGPLPHDALLARMRRTKVYALPARYEPFGLSALEAARCGCALVLSDLATLREVWGDAATYCPPDDPAAWARVIDDLLRDDDRRSHLAAAATERSRRYSPSVQASAYTDVYRKLGSRGTACRRSVRDGASSRHDRRHAVPRLPEAVVAFGNEVLA